MQKYINLPLTKDKVLTLKAGDRVYLTGEIFTARDAAHKRLCESIEKGEKLPFDINDATIFFVGPTPAKEGQIIGSAGPTTSYRMDSYSPILLKHGLSGMIGKGDRSAAVVEAMKNFGGVYFAAIGGAGALISKCIKKSEVIAYSDLGTEAIRRLYVENMPLFVVIDSLGNNLYKTARKDFKESDF